VHRNEKARRATIKALPTFPNRPRPYGSLDFLPLSLAEVDAYWGYFRGGEMARELVEILRCAQDDNRGVG